MDKQVKLTKDIYDDLDNSEVMIVPSGTIVNFISNEGDYIIVELLDGSVSFPVNSDEYEAI